MATAFFRISRSWRRIWFSRSSGLIRSWSGVRRPCPGNACSPSLANFRFLRHYTRLLDDRHAACEGAIAFRLDVVSSTSSTIDLADLPASNTRVRASGAGKVTVNGSGSLDVAASGSSRVLYVGNPTLGSLHTSGASSISQQ